VRRCGFEWLWRIKEEPYLWRRYFQDGLILLKLMLTSVLPLALGSLWRGIFGTDGTALEVSFEQGRLRTVKLAGHAVERHVASAIPIFREAIDKTYQLTVDVSGLKAIDPRFLGLLLIVRKQMRARGGRLQIVGAPSRLRRAFRLNRFEFLLNSSSAIDKQSDLVPELAFAHSEVAIGVSPAQGKL
jgi:N-acetylglucosaminyldiphosphoundecaprenol N-acetyl-beta-D-mannosaminyltransferase